MASQTCALAPRLLETDGSVVAQGREVIEQRGITVAIAELQIIADVPGLIQVVAVVALRQALRRIERHPGLIDVRDHLIASGSNSEAAGADLVARALLLSLVAIKDSQGDPQGSHRRSCRRRCGHTRSKASGRWCRLRSPALPQPLTQ